MSDTPLIIGCPPIVLCVCACYRTITMNIAKIGVCYYNYAAKPGFFHWVGWGLEIVQTKAFGVSNSFWYHFTAHTCGYISIVAYMDLTLASNFFLAG